MEHIVEYFDRNIIANIMIMEYSTDGPIIMQGQGDREN